MSDLDLDDLLEAATPGWEDVHLMLDAARREEWNHLVQASVAVDPPEGDPDARFGAKSPRAQAEKLLAALKQELQSKILTIRVMQMPGTEWAALKAKHKPRKDNPLDAAYGHYNIEAVAREALVKYGKRVRRDGDDVTLEPVSAGQWGKIFEKVGGGDFQTLIMATIGVNQLIGQTFVGALVKGSPATSNYAGK